MKLITISGLDGSGKSTQIELLRNLFESQGKKVFYFHAVNFSIGNKFSRKHKENSKNEKSIIKTNWLGIILRKIALKIDLCRFRLLRSKLRSKSYDYILSDRFFHDSVINIGYLVHHHPRLPAKQKVWNNKDAAIFFYLKTDPQTIMQRDRKPDQGLQYLEDKQKLYDEYFQNLPGVKIIDGNRSKEAIFEEIKSTI